MTIRNAFDKVATEASAADTSSLLRRMLMTLLSPLGYDKLLRRYRHTAVIESGTVTTVTTVNAVNGVSNLTNIDGRPGAMLMNAQSRQSWAQNVRARIT